MMDNVLKEYYELSFIREVQLKKIKFRGIVLDDIQPLIKTEYIVPVIEIEETYGRNTKYSSRYTKLF